MGPSWGRGWKFFRGISLVDTENEEPIPISGSRVLFGGEVAGPGCGCEEGLSQERCWGSAGAFTLLSGVFFSSIFGFCLKSDGLIGSVNCHLFILVRGEVSCFSWSVWY